jgi:hypothetical protein
MNRNDKPTLVLGLLGSLAVLAVTNPSPAMHDPVTGRWTTRDPLQYKTGNSPGVVGEDWRAGNPTATAPARIFSTATIPPHALERQLALARQFIPARRDTSLNSYLLLSSRPMGNIDPLGTTAEGPDCPTGIEYAHETTTDPWDPPQPSGCSDARGTRTTTATITCTTMTLEITRSITSGCEGVCVRSYSRGSRSFSYGNCTIVSGATRTDVFDEHLPIITVISSEDSCQCFGSLRALPARET